MVEHNRFFIPSSYRYDEDIDRKDFFMGIREDGLLNFFRYLKRNGFVSDKYISYQRFDEYGLFETELIATSNSFGTYSKQYQTFLTPKGIDYFKERLISEGYTDLDFTGEPEGFISDYIITKLEEE